MAKLADLELTGEALKEVVGGGRPRQGNENGNGNGLQYAFEWK